MALLKIKMKIISIIYYYIINPSITLYHGKPSLKIVFVFEENIKNLAF